MDAILSSIRHSLNDPLIVVLASIPMGVLANLVFERIRNRVKHLWWGTRSAYDTLLSAYDPVDEDEAQEHPNTGTHSKRRGSPYICRLVFWSSGNDTLLDRDISSHEPLEVGLGGDNEILGITEITKSNPSIRLEISGKNRARIEFEYLEGGQGAVYDFVYIGAKARPNLRGAIKGGKLSTKEVSTLPISESVTPKFHLFFGWLRPEYQIYVMRYLVTTLFIMALWLTIVTPEMSASGSMPTEVLVVIFGIGSLLLWRIAVVPKGLRRFYSAIVDQSSWSE